MPLLVLRTVVYLTSPRFNVRSSFLVISSLATTTPTPTMPAFECKWGILATGSIAKTFVKDLLLDPATRGVSDVKHVVTAVASSSSAERAQQFLNDVQHPSPQSVATYGDYEQLVSDPNVDVIYIATPHTMHYANTLLCLRAGKPVLCEVRRGWSRAKGGFRTLKTCVAC